MCHKRMPGRHFNFIKCNENLKRFQFFAKNNFSSFFTPADSKAVKEANMWKKDAIK